MIKKGAGVHMVSSMHIFSPIDLKCTKLPKKRLQPIIITNFFWGKNINQEVGEGAKV